MAQFLQYKTMPAYKIILT